MSTPERKTHTEERGAEYIATKAKTMCDCATGIVRFIVPEGRMASIGDGYVGISSDSLHNNFDGNFGTCMKTKEQCVKDFLPTWFNASTNVFYCESHGDKMTDLVRIYLGELEEAKKNTRIFLAGMANRQSLEDLIAGLHLKTTPESLKDVSRFLTFDQAC